MNKYRHISYLGSLAISLGVQACAGPDSADLDEELEPRIVEGKLTTEWEAVVAVGIFNPNKSGICSGTQITDNLILTAGHCVTYDADDGSLQVVEPSDIYVYWGQDVLNGFYGEDDPTMIGIRLINEIVVHPVYDGATGPGFDLALLVIDGSGPVTPLPIRTEDERVPDGELVSKIGFGRYDLLNDDGTISLERDGRKREGIADLAAADQVASFPVPAQDLYATDGSLSNSCFGDSGGPLIAAVDGEVFVIGTSSYVDSLDCDAGSFFSRIDIAEDFVDERVNIKPILECVEIKPEGYRIAIFGYDNPAGWVVKRPLGPTNTLSPGGETTLGGEAFALPTSFHPGHQASAFTVSLELDEVVTWTLGDHTATSDDVAPPCP